MAMTVGELTAYLDVKDQQYNAKVDAAGKRFRGLGGVITSTGAKIASGLAAAGIASFIKSSISAASDLNESTSKTQVVFGGASDAIIKWASTSASAFGMSKQAALEAVGTYGNLFTAMGIGAKPTQDMSKGLVELAADLASFNNIDPAEALEKLRAGIVGETEPLRVLGVNLTAATVQEEAYRLGLGKEGEELSAAAKAQASYSLIMQQTKTAQGDFARTSGGLANKQRILRATLTDLSASVGTAFLPAMTALAGVLTKVMSGFNALPGPVKAVAAGIAGLLVAGALIAPLAKNLSFLVTAYKFLFVAKVKDGIITRAGAVQYTILRAKMLAHAVAAKAVTAGQWLLNAAMSANPIGLIIAAVALLVVGFIVAYKKSETFRKIVQGALKAVAAAALWAWDKVKTIWSGLKWLLAFFKKHWALILAAVVGPVALMVSFVIKHWEAIKAATSRIWEAIKNVIKAIVLKIWNVINGLVRIYARMFSIGRQLVKGLWTGIKSLAHWLWEKVTGWAGGIYDAVKEGLGKLWPFSPSVAGVELGYFLALGIEKGIKSGLPAVSRAVGGLKAQMQIATAGQPALAVSGGNLGAAPGRVVQAAPAPTQPRMGNVHIHIGTLVGTDERAARQLSDMIGKHLMRGVLRGMVGQNG